MNKLSSLMFSLIIPASIVLTGCGAGHHSNCAMPASQQAIRSVTVVGHGEAMGKPDVARTSLGVEASAATVQEAMDQTTAKMNAILDALKKMGIAEKDIKTANFSISIERPYPEPGPMPAMEPVAAPVAPVKPGGKAAATATVAPPPRPMPTTIYRVNNTVEVVVRDVSKASRVVQAAVDAGANNVWNVSFAIDDTKALEADALYSGYLARQEADIIALVREGGLLRLEESTYTHIQEVAEQRHAS